jgi:catechol 2,3-dioxygenase-like lactoylglutathione lyase family enzyme
MAAAAEKLTGGIDHVGLTVLDLETTKRFFCDCLGWAVVGGNPNYPAAFVSDGHVVLTLWQVQNPDECARFDRKSNLGLHHIAIKVPSMDDLQALFDRVAAWPGVKVEFAPELLGQGPKTHFMMSEPGGIRIEFACNPNKG